MAYINGNEIYFGIVGDAGKQEAFATTEVLPITDGIIEDDIIAIAEQEE